MVSVATNTVQNIVPDISHAATSPAAAHDAVATPSDHQLMLAVRDGDIDRLGELFERHHRRLYAFLLRVTGGQAAASEDIVQNVFHRILKYRHTYRNDGSFTTWMYHMARMCCADHFRKSALSPAITDPEVLQEHPDTEASPDARADTTDDIDLLRVALDRLPPDHREVLVLSRLQGLEHSETARILECSVGAVKVRAHRALKALRETFISLRDSPSRRARA